ncbi:MAG: class I tRNA ligase family protein, partial [Chloroflexi bacterium]|nr:class I tRNA ligase family protein [Chloroflexota bacterium]
DTKLDLQKVEGARNFANKIWNMGRFIISNLQTANLKADNLNLEKLRRGSLSLPDRWILSRLHRAIATVNQSFTAWQFGEGTRAVYEFLWDEFADWYIEAAKIALTNGDARAKQRTLSVLVYAFDQALRLLHPVMPFVTEEVWQHLKRALENDFTGDFAGPAPTRGALPEALIVAPFPKANPKWNDARAEKEFDALRDAIRAIRNARTEFKVEAGLRIPAIFSAGSARQLFASHRDVIAMLAHLDTHALTIEKTAAKPTRALALVAGGAEIFLPFAGMLDVEKERARLKREMEKTRADVARQETLLASEFSKRAPKQVVEKTKEQLAANTDRLGKLDALLASLEGRAPKKKSSVKNAKKKTKRK